MRSEPMEFAVAMALGTLDRYLDVGQMVQAFKAHKIRRIAIKATAMGLVQHDRVLVRAQAIVDRMGQEGGANG